MDYNNYRYNDTNWHKGAEKLYSNNKVGTVDKEPSSVSIVSPPVLVSEVQVVVPEVPVSANKIVHLDWSLYNYNGEGKLVGFDGKLWSQYAVIKLQTLCSKLQVHGVENARKDLIVDAIFKNHHNLHVYSTIKEVVDSNQPGTTKNAIDQQFDGGN
jgi:hypothetical protein